MSATKVLVIDDSRLLHKMYELAFRAYPGGQIEARFAADGREGLALLHEQPDTDLIFLDINMPTMSGLEFLQLMKAEEAVKDIPVVLQSTEDHQADIDRGVACGAASYLTKPFSPKEVHGLLDRLAAPAA